MTKALKKIPSKDGKPDIPEFASIQEEADFWDTHSTEDYDWEDVEDDIEFILVRAQKKQPMTVRLEPDVLTLLAREAKSVGVGPSTLARMAILKYLKHSGRGTFLPKNERKVTKRKRARGAA